ncbi:hypothetical protein INR49_009300 [Caranx melampygus]|nr:hypothetical protein INR49_009300 [Caranx melampygus]
MSCAAPSPGDTLPWNLPRHHRMKRSKSASGDVLDPAERAVIRIAGTSSTQVEEASAAVDEWYYGLAWFVLLICGSGSGHVDGLV